MALFICYPAMSFKGRKITKYWQNDSIFSFYFEMLRALFTSILSPHLSGKNSNLPSTPGIGRAFKVVVVVFLIGYFEKNWSDMHFKRNFLTCYSKNTRWKLHLFLWTSTQKINFCLYSTHKMTIFQFSRACSHFDVIVTSYIDGLYLFWYQWK